MPRVLRDLMPRVGVTLAAIRDAIGASLENLRSALAAIIQQANPGTATTSLQQWYETLGLRYGQTLTLATRQAIARQAFISLGNQSLDTINTAIQIAFPDVYLSRPKFITSLMVGVGMVGLMQVTDYPSWLPVGALADGAYPVSYYLVGGAVNSAAERTALLNFLDRIAPAHMEPVIGDLIIRDQTATAEAGLAMVGLAQAGRTKEDA